MDRLKSLARANGLSTISYLDAPPWHLRCSPNDWKTHVPADLMELWPTLSLEARLAVYIVAETHADNEIVLD
jgi:hypothetical protein